MNLDEPLSKELVQKLGDALKELDKGKLKQTCDRIDDVLDKSINDIGKKKPKLTVAQAEQIVGDAYLAEQLLGCIELDSTLPAAVQSVVDVIDTIDGLGASGGTEDDLTTKAKDAGKKLVADKKNATKDACRKLDELDQTATRKLTEAQYAELLPALQAARSAIGC